MRALTSVALVLCVAGLLSQGCADAPPATPGPPPAAIVEDLQPRLIVPGSVLRVQARSFSLQAIHDLELTATGVAQSIRLPLTLEGGKLSAQLDGQNFKLLGLGKQALSVRVHSRNDWGNAASTPLLLDVELADKLTPMLSLVGDGLVYLNGEVDLEGSGLLLDSAEGKTEVVLDGCFLPAGRSGDCSSAGTLIKRSLPLLSAETDRRRGRFLYAPEIAGIQPGRFSGTATLINRQVGQPALSSTPRNVTFDVQPSRLEALGPEMLSLGQFLDLEGRGFVGGQGSTLIDFSGTFTPDDGGPPRQVDLTLVTGFVSGTELRYVLEEGIGLGKALDPRRERGTLAGQWKPVLSWGGVQLDGVGTQLSVRLAAVRQVVHVRFLETWRTALRSFGLQPADAAVRARVMDVLAEAYASLNVEFREEAPTDFGLFAVLDIAGEDPNGLGLLGYDNTPGKDIDNKRLFDHIGGVNALTQEDGYPGYGGVFALSQLGFSEHPPTGVQQSPLHVPLFDAIFDPVRPDRGREVTFQEVSAAPTLTDGGSCPAQDRPTQIACAIRVLGNVVGHTAAHELGHSLGLAEPYGAPTTYHNPGDVPKRMMEGGSGRPFAERAELEGQGPAVFCDEEYAYLRLLLPTATPDPTPQRPSCY